MVRRQARSIAWHATTHFAARSRTYRVLFSLVFSGRYVYAVRVGLPPPKINRSPSLIGNIRGI